ncbi:ligase-associated DNA damage response DEXH box helicase [Catalinimonas alkaloidigena]|nr:ligase-associated DNA damage response DEXH box helicase [Catalinimonas alkaloidigena]
MSTLSPLHHWFHARGWQVFPFQEETWQAFLEGKNGLLNAPTGSGKTLALWGACVADYLHDHPDAWQTPRKNGLRVLWITPLRALAKDLQKAMQGFCDDLGLPWRVELRTGDTSSSVRQRQLKSPPECLIITPESLHILLSQKDARRLLGQVRACVVDEWHELLGNKRGVQVELGLARLREFRPSGFRTWGISATIANLEEARDVLLGESWPGRTDQRVIVRAELDKRLRLQTLFPDRIDRFPWSGHLGLQMVEKVLPIIQQSRTTLLFCNTRAQTELWYRQLLEADLTLAGQIAMHHGSIDAQIRSWVEEALKEGRVKVVVCTSSLDLGVDFAPVETIVQIGSTKSLARLLQRAGRSGHQPGAESVLYFVPTHALELMEAAAFKEGIRRHVIEGRAPLQAPIDVLAQYLVTLAVGEGFRADEQFDVVTSTHAYRNLSLDEWDWVLHFITTGGASLGAYDEFSRVDVTDDGLFRIASRKAALRHRLGIGTIVSNPMLRLKLVGGSTIGQVEENFVGKLEPGDTFWFAGQVLEFVRLKELTVFVRKARRKTGVLPRWQGNRMPLSSVLADLLREKMEEAAHHEIVDEELVALQPLFDVQRGWSALPERQELLVEHVKTREGYHLFLYPFEGRVVHEMLATLFAYRFSQLRPVSISFASNDYGLELLADQPFPLELLEQGGLFSAEHLREDLQQAVHTSELTSRRFREVAVIAGLVFQGYPGRPLTGRHLQASTKLMYDVMQRYDPHNLLLQQAHREVMEGQLESTRLHHVLMRLQALTPLVQQPPRPTPLGFPILVDRMRETISSEKLEDRIAKMTLQLERALE